jgi:hypothetical protein
LLPTRPCIRSRSGVLDGRAIGAGNLRETARRVEQRLEGYVGARRAVVVAEMTDRPRRNSCGGKRTADVTLAIWHAVAADLFGPAAVERPPRPLADEGRERRDEQAADDERIDQDAQAHGQADLEEQLKRRRHERSERAGQYQPG